MTDSPLFSADAVLCDIHATSQKQLFQEIATCLIDVYELGDTLACRDIVAAAVERERLGATGVGNGVALPHARIEGLDRVVAAFARLDTPLEFDAVDDRAVDLIVFLLAPADAGGAHLRALAKTSRLLRRQDMRQRLRAAPNAESLFAILSETEQASSAA